MTGNRRQPQPYEAVVDRAADRVIASLPGVALPAARALVADASTRYTVRQLDEYLEAHPDALTSGSSEAPMMIQALARRLVDAGHPDVRVPGCLRCADQTQLRYKVDGGRICDRCQRLSRHAPCAGCGRDRLISTRDEQARPLCPSCAEGRNRETCGRCGLSGRVAARNSDGSALCPNCYQVPIRRCCRCDRPAPTYINTPDGPACKACYERPRRRCGGCGLVRRIDLRATATRPDLCVRCRSRRRRDCFICGASHPANPRAAQPVCLTCRTAGHVLEPDLVEPPDRTRRRRHETAGDVVRKRLSDLLSHDDTGIADQLIPLIDTFDHVPNLGSAMQWLRSRSGGPPLLQEISRRAHSEPITHELLDSYPQNYALHRLRDLFVFARILPVRAELLARVELWLEQLLAQRPDHHGNLVRPFAAWHALRRARQRARRRALTPNAATYVRTQVTVALDFLSWLDDRGRTLTTANQADLDTWLSSRAQTSYFLATFISWAKARSLCDLTVPARPRTQPHKILDDDDRWNTLRRCLHDELVPLDVRAAAVLVLLFGRGATSFAHLTVNDIRQIGGETYLQLGDFTALLPPAAAAVFRALSDATTSRETFHHTEPQSRFLFPGRSPGKPAAAHVIARRLRAHGISALTARNSARAAWTRDIPGPIAADLLGIHISTATQWATCGRRDWADYISARADAQHHDHASEQADTSSTIPLRLPHQSRRE